MADRKFEVFGKEIRGHKIEGEGNCITYPVKRAYIFAETAKEAEEIFFDVYADTVDEVLTRETREIEMTPEEIEERAAFHYKLTPAEAVELGLEVEHGTDN